MQHNTHFWSSSSKCDPTAHHPTASTKCSHTPKRETEPDHEKDKTLSINLIFLFLAFFSLYRLLFF